MSRQERAKKAHQVNLVTNESDFETINELDSLPVTPKEIQTDAFFNRTSAIKIEDSEPMDPKKLNIKEPPQTTRHKDIKSREKGFNKYFNNKAAQTGKNG